MFLIHLLACALFFLLGLTLGLCASFTPSLDESRKKANDKDNNHSKSARLLRLTGETGLDSETSFREALKLYLEERGLGASTKIRYISCFTPVITLQGAPDLQPILIRPARRSFATVHEAKNALVDLLDLDALDRWLRARDRSLAQARGRLFEQLPPCTGSWNVHSSDRFHLHLAGNEDALRTWLEEYVNTQSQNGIEGEQKPLVAIDFEALEGKLAVCQLAVSWVSPRASTGRREVQVQICVCNPWIHAEEVDGSSSFSFSPSLAVLLRAQDVPKMGWGTSSDLQMLKRQAQMVPVQFGDLQHAFSKSLGVDPSLSLRVACLNFLKAEINKEIEHSQWVWPLSRLHLDYAATDALAILYLSRLHQLFRCVYVE